MEFLGLIIFHLQQFLNNPQVLEMVVNNRFLLIFLVILLLKFKYSTYSSMLLSALINIPGTFLHETMHYFVGLISNAEPTSFTIIPRRGENGGYTMGSVGFRNISYYNAIPSSMAPLLLLPLGFYFNRWYFQNVDISLFNYMGYILLQTIIIENAVPSGQDFKVAFSQPLGLVLYGALFVAAMIAL